MRNKKKPNTHTNCEYKRHTAMECLENIRQVHSLAINHSDCVYAYTVCALPHCKHCFSVSQSKIALWPFQAFPNVFTMIFFCRYGNKSE